MKNAKMLTFLSVILIGIALLALAMRDAAMSAPSKSDRIPLGMYEGRVSYDSEKGCYFIEVRGARFPFKTDPREALKVPLEAPGEDSLAKHSALLLGMMGKKVSHTTILINPDEEDEVMPAVQIVALGLFRIITVPALLRRSWGLINLQKSLKGLAPGFFCFFMPETFCET